MSEYAYRDKLSRGPDVGDELSMDTLEVDTLSVDVLSVVSGCAVSERIVSGRVVSGHVVSGRVVSGCVVSGHVVSGHIVSGQVVSGRIDIMSKNLILLLFSLQTFIVQFSSEVKAEESPIHFEGGPRNPRRGREN